MNLIRKISPKKLRESDDWQIIFGQESGMGFSNVPSSANPGSDVSLDPVFIDDVQEVISIFESINDGWVGIGLFRLKDGRYLSASGGCDMTGWDCGGSSSLMVSKTLAEIIVFGISESEAYSLGLSEQRKLAEPIFSTIVF